MRSVISKAFHAAYQTEFRNEICPSPPRRYGSTSARLNWRSEVMRRTYSKRDGGRDFMTGFDAGIV